MRNDSHFSAIAELLKAEPRAGRAVAGHRKWAGPPTDPTRDGIELGRAASDAFKRALGVRTDA